MSLQQTKAIFDLYGCIVLLKCTTVQEPQPIEKGKYIKQLIDA